MDDEKDKLNNRILQIECRCNYIFDYDNNMFGTNTDKKAVILNALDIIKKHKVDSNTFPALWNMLNDVEAYMVLVFKKY